MELTLFTVAAIVFGLFMGFAGMNHLLNHKKMIQMAKDKKIPLPGLSIIISGLMLIFSGLTFIFQTEMQLGITVLVIFLALASFFVHNFWSMQDPQMKQINRNFFMSNISLAAVLAMLCTFLG